MKQPRPNLNDELARPTSRSLLAFLAQTEEPVRVRVAREALKLGIGQFGLAMRSLERCGLALRRNLSVGEETAPRMQHLYIEATDLGREHARMILASASQARPTA